MPAVAAANKRKSGGSDNELEAASGTQGAGATVVLGSAEDVDATHAVGKEVPVASGPHQIRVEFTYDGGGLGKGGEAVLFVDGNPVGSARQEASIPMAFSADETLDLGLDAGTPVSDDYKPETSRFDGTINWVQLDLGNDDHTHLITAEERLRVAMIRQ